MMDFWRFVFSDFWHWLGFAILLYIVCIVAAQLAVAIVGSVRQK